MKKYLGELVFWIFVGISMGVIIIVGTIVGFIIFMALRIFNLLN